MCVKLFSRDLNLNPYPPHPTSSYTCEVTIAPRVLFKSTKLYIVCKYAIIEQEVPSIFLNEIYSSNNNR